MQTLKATISLEIDGQPVAGYPVIKTLNVESMQSFSYEKPAGGHLDVPLSELTTLQFLVLRPSTEVELRLDGQTDAGIVLEANGLILIAGATIDNVTLATISNAAAAVIKGIGAGVLVSP